MLASRYQAEFACDDVDATVMHDVGVRVEGCNQVAFYHCDPTSYRELGGPDCVLEHSRPLTDQERLPALAREQAKVEEAAPVQKARVANEQRQADFAQARQKLAARPDSLAPPRQVELDDSRIELARLSDDPRFVLLRFSTKRALSAAPCRPTIVRDNRTLAAETIGQHTGHDADFLLVADDLQGLDTAQRLRGVICGVDFTLDEAARRKLAY